MSIAPITGAIKTISKDKILYSTAVISLLELIMLYPVITPYLVTPDSSVNFTCERIEGFFHP